MSIKCTLLSRLSAPIAQLNRATAVYAVGFQFESGWEHNKN